MPTLLKPVLAGVVVIAALVVGGIYLTRDPDSSNLGGPDTGTPSPSAAASSTAAPSATPDLTDTTTWIPFTSERYGYTMSLPAHWETTPAVRDWSSETDVLAIGPQSLDAADIFIDRDAAWQIAVTAVAVEVPSDMSEDVWIGRYYGGLTDGCDPIADLRRITIGGLPGRIGNDCFDSNAFVFHDGRVHVFAVWRPNSEKLLNAFLSTVEFPG